MREYFHLIYFLREKVLYYYYFLNNRESTLGKAMKVVKKKEGTLLGDNKSHAI